MTINDSILLLTTNGDTIQNATGLIIQPSLIDGVYYNYHIFFIESALSGILLIFMLFFGIYMYRWFTRGIAGRDLS